MEQLARCRLSQQSRYHALAMEIGFALENVLFCQVWSAQEGQQDQRNPVVLRVEAQSALMNVSDTIKTYANLSSLCGIRAEAMDLIGDCRAKGATRVVEDLEHADPRQHPRNLLPGEEIPACSALFLPIFDPSDPFSRHGLTGSLRPSALLEVLVCKSARMRHNSSDLLNAACSIMDKYKFGVSADTTAFREWARSLAPSSTQASGALTPPKQAPRSSMSRTSSRFVLTSDSESEGALPAVSDGQTCKQSSRSKHPVLSERQHMMGVPSIAS